MYADPVRSLDLVESVSHRSRILSEFIRKLSKDELLLPERCNDLDTIVGQGKIIV